MKNFLMILSVAVTSLAGCVHECVIYRNRVPNSSDKIATQEPPPVIEARITIAPSPVHLWIGGHWGPAPWRLRLGAGLLGTAAAPRRTLGARRMVAPWPTLALASWSLALMQVVEKNDGLRV